MTEAEYRADFGVNKSTLWEIRKSPAHYKYALENQEESDSPALRLGRAVHALVLQPDDFDNMYAIAPNVDRRTKEGKQAWSEFVEANQGKEILTADEASEVGSIALSVNAVAGDLLEGCQTEVPLFWDDRRTGIRCKARLDAWKELPDKFVVIDLKTTIDASTEAFTRSAVKLGYHVQAAHYLNGFEAVRKPDKPVEWWFIAVEKRAPYAVNLIRADDGFVIEGRFKLMDLMDRLDQCLRTNKWPGYGENVMYMPAWAMDNGEDE